MNITESRLTKQCENYAIDTDRLRQKFQDRDQDKGSVTPSGYDTIDISEDGRQALEQRLMDTFRERQGIKAAGTLVNVSQLSVFENFEKAVSAEQRDKTATNNFDRHVDKMVSAYTKMKREIEEKYANMSQEQQEQIYYVADTNANDIGIGIQQLTKEKELELLDKAYEQHSMGMAAFTESLDSLRDFKPQIRYHRSGSQMEDRFVDSSQTATADGEKTKKGEIRNQAYQVFLSAIGKGDFQSDSGVSASAKRELNRIWDHYAV